MKWKIFEEWFDIKLYSQMCDMIYRLSQKEEKKQLWEEAGKYALFPGCCKEKLEDAYDFRYPGEVLERLGEKKEVAAPQIRALGLALAVSSPLHGEGMFVGTQLASFRKRLKGFSGENAPYILGIRYLLEEKTKKELYEEFLAYPFAGIEEILFAISILPEDENLWEKVKNGLNESLGNKRKISIYENEEVYIWLAEHLQEKMKGYRKKDMDSLKYLIRLPFANANGAGVLQEKLEKSGYSIEEIRFLNMVLVWREGVAGSINRDSITAEKIAVDMCRQFLSSKKEYPDSVYQLCACLCGYYNEFGIKINGWESIFEAIGPFVEVSNVAVYRLLYAFKNGRHVKEEWSYIDLTDSRWDSLYECLGEKEFDEFVTNTLSEKEYSGDQVSFYLNHYREITGKEYSRYFWEKQDYGKAGVFGILSDLGILEPVLLVQKFIEEYRHDKDEAETKWKNMAFYLNSMPIESEG